eukprot:15453483-Alexandrium_andersonii.AAC.1
MRAESVACVAVPLIASLWRRPKCFAVSCPCSQFQTLSGFAGKQTVRQWPKASTVAAHPVIHRPGSP